MQDEVRASLDDLAIRWETPKGRELKAKVIEDARRNRGERIGEILAGFLYVAEVSSGRDLRCVTLDGEDLSEAVFGKIDLSWASFGGCAMQRSDLRHATLKRANFCDADLSLARLEHADCQRADFSRAKLDGAHFREARLTGAVFEGADVSRASFESANMSKTNFRGARLEQTNFFNADCNNSNFDGTGLDRVAARPAKAWGLRYDMEREEFEKQVGLNAITSRTTKRFKGLDALLKLQTPSAPAADAGKKDDGEDVVFGAVPRGMGKIMPEGQRPTAAMGEPVAQEGGTAAWARSTRRMETSGAGPESDGQAPPAPEAARGPERPTSRGAPPPRPTGPGGPPPRPGTGPVRPPAAGPGGPGPGAGQGPPRPTGRSAAPPGARPVRPPPPQGPPRIPLAPLDPDAPEPATDWAKAIGQLMQLKGSISKVVIELGDKSRIVYKVDPPAG